MKKYQKLGAILTIILGGSTAATAANANSAYNNLPSNVQNVDANDLGIGGGLGGFIANEFSTSTLCPSGCTLNNITLNLSSSSGSTGGFQLQIFTNVANKPGAAVFTMNNPGSFSTDFNNNVFVPPGTFKLANNTNYWVELSNSNGNGDLLYWDSLSGAKQTGATNEPNLGYFNIGGYSPAPSALNLLMNVQVTSIGGAGTAVPIPGALWMMGPALLGLAASWHRKSRK